MKYLPFAIFLLVLIACKAVPSSSRSDPTPKESPKIYYSQPKVTKEYGLTELNFEVTNASLQRLEFVKIQASFYDKDGLLVTSESPYIERYTGLAPGERSPAKVMTMAKGIARYQLRFVANSDTPFETIDLDAEILEAPKKKKK